MNLNLDRLQEYLAKNNIEAFLLSAHDQFFCECPPWYDKRLKWLTGFSGSFAVVIVTEKQCYFFTDSRYEKFRFMIPNVITQFHIIEIKAILAFSQ